MLPRPTIQAFDAWLETRSLRLEAIVVGGSALALLGVTDRQTRDFDILHPVLPPEITTAAQGFAARLREDGIELADDWLNNGPITLSELLPDGWRLRLRVVFEGAALTLTTLGRMDLLKTKLFALCDRGIDLADCIAMAPSSDEIERAGPWIAVQDANEMWPTHVHTTLRDLRERLGYVV